MLIKRIRTLILYIIQPDYLKKIAPFYLYRFIRSLSRSSTGSSTSGSGSGYTALTVNVLFSGFCSGLPARSVMLFMGMFMVYVSFG